MAGVWVPVLASMKGFISEVQKGATDAASSASKELEQGLTDGAQAGGKSAADAMAQQFETAAKKVSAARKQEASATGEVAVAEEELRQVRANSESTTSQNMAAEAKLEDAKRKQEAATGRLSTAQSDLDSVRAGGEAQASSLTSAENSLEDAQLKSQAAADNVAVAEQKAQEARQNSVDATARAETAEVQLALAKMEAGEGSKEANKADRELEKARRDADKASVAAEKAEAGVGRARADAATATDSAEGAELRLEAAKERAARAANDAADAADNAGSSISEMGDEAAGADPKAGGLAGSLGDLAGKAVLTAGAFVGVRGIGDMISSGFDKVSSIEDTTASLSILMGSAEEATATMDLLTESNMATPYSFDAWSEAGKNLIAFGFDAEQANDAMVALGEAASASGKGEQALTSMTDAFGKAAAAGRISGDLINSLAMGGVDALAILGNEFGVTSEEMQKMISNGTVPVEEAFEALTEGIVEGTDGINGSTLAMGGVMEEMSETTSGRLGLLKMSFVNLGGDLVNLVMPAIKGVADIGIEVVGFIRDLIAGLNEGEGPLARFKDVFEFLSPILKPMAAMIGGIATAIIIKTAAMSAYHKVADLAAAATGRFKKALDLLAKNKIIVIIGLIVGALTWFFTQTEIGQKLWSGFVDFMGTAWEKIKGFFSAAWDAIQPVWDGIVEGAEALRERMQPVFDWIGEAWQKVVDFFTGGEGGGGFFDGLMAKFEEFGNGVQQWYATWIEPTVNLFKAGIDLLVDAVTWWIENVTLPALDLLGQAFQILWNGPVGMVIEAFKTGVEILGAVLTGIFEGVIVPAWNFVGDHIQNVWNNLISPVWEFVKSAAGMLADILTGNFENISNRFSEMGEAIDGIVQGVIQFAMDTFKNIVNAVGDTWNAFKDTVSDVVSAVAGYISDMMGRIADIPNQIGSLFADAGSWLLNAGRNIINGLWQGMQNAWTNVRNWLSETLSFSAIGSLIGLSGGGIVMVDGGIVMRDGGMLEQYAAGGIRQLESYANGGRRENHVAQIAPAGAWRVWAEDETGGEAYIPLHPAKRARSTAILDEVAGRFGYTLVDNDGAEYAGGYNRDLGPQHVTAFADGAVVDGEEMLSFVHGGNVGGQQASGSLEGWPYENFPSDPGAWGDCSYAVGKVAALAVGVNTPGRHFATMNEASVLSSWGFSRGRGEAGDLLIGFRNGGPGGGHTSGTLPDGTNFEMGGARGNGQIGGPAAGAWDSYYTDFFYMPVAPGFEDVELDDLAAIDGLDSASGYSPGAEAEAITAGAAGTSTADTGGQETTISGMAGSTAGDLVNEIVSGHVSDFLSVFGITDQLPSWVIAGRQLNTELNARTSVAEDHAEARQNEAVTSMTGDEIAADPQLSSMGDMDVTVQPEVPEWGEAFFVHEIARQAHDMGLDAAAARIGVATALVESGDPMQMYANNAVPESLNYRHDAIGSDHDSVGLFQQRNNGAWGTTAERMDPYESAGMFFRELVKFDWESMDPGAAAQKVQRSAFPDRYATKMGRAEELVSATSIYSPVAEAEAITAEAAALEDLDDRTALYDRGGILDDEHFALNLSGKPEAVLTNDQWQMLSGLGDNLPELVGSTVSSGVSGVITAGAGSAAGMADMVVPGAGVAVSGLAGPAAQLGGWYAGEVATGWTDALITAGRQAAGAVMEPLQDLSSAMRSPAVPAVSLASAPTLDNEYVPERSQGDGDGPSNLPGVNIYVQSVAEALEAKRHEEARQMLGMGRNR